MIALTKLQSMPRWFHCSVGWKAFLGVEHFHHFTWIVEWDHNAEWTRHIRNQRDLRATEQRNRWRWPP